jgi:hypothetical protein
MQRRLLRFAGPSHGECSGQLLQALELPGLLPQHAMQGLIPFEVQAVVVEKAASLLVTSLQAGPSGPGAVAVLRARDGASVQLLSCWEVPQSCAREPSMMAVC